jgi:hypothetical protein
MKGVDWSKTRKVLEAVTVCLGITIIANKGYYGALMLYSNYDDC